MSSKVQNQVVDGLKLGRELERAMLAAIDRTKRTCFNCACFVEASLYCQHHRGNPPPRVVAFGCDNFLPSDEVPY